jgi:AraC-like DNA-binding protein
MAATAHANAKPNAGRALVRRYDYLPDHIRAVHRSARTEDYCVEPFDDPSSYPEIEAIIPLGHDWNYRLQYAAIFGNGRSEICGLADGFYVAINDYELDEPMEMVVTAPDMLRIRIASKGYGEYVVADEAPVDLDGPSTLVVIEPAGAPPSRCANQGHNRSVQLYIQRDALQALYEGDERDLPGVLQAFLAGGLQRTVARRLPLTPALLRCLEDLHNNDCEGRTRRHYIQSKAMEIFCHAFEALENEDADGADSVEASMITSRGVLRAQAVLMEKFVSPPSLDDLAHEVGLSRTSLTAGFRRILGQSVFDYIQDLRMQHAMALLNEPGSTITQVAYAVGYNHLSSFSVAVQRRFGATPRDLRRRAALPDL